MLKLWFDWYTSLHFLEHKCKYFLTIFHINGNLSVFKHNSLRFQTTDGNIQFARDPSVAVSPVVSSLLLWKVKASLIFIDLATSPFPTKGKRIWEDCKKKDFVANRVDRSEIHARWGVAKRRDQMSKTQDSMKPPTISAPCSLNSTNDKSQPRYSSRNIDNEYTGKFFRPESLKRTFLYERWKEIVKLSRPPGTEGARTKQSIKETPQA